jgi:hypothetical protein
MGSTPTDKSQNIGATDAERLEDAIIVASLAHATANTPSRRADAWKRLMSLKAQRDDLRRGAA